MQPFAFNTRYVQCPIAIIEFEHYQDASLAMRVLDSVTGETLSTATVCMMGYNETPAAGNVFIKDYSENEGVVEALHEADIIGQPIRWLDAGHAKQGVAECPLLIEVEASPHG